MEQKILDLVEDIVDMEHVIGLRLDEGTISERIMPSEPLESIAEQIQIATDDQGRKRKFIEVEIDGEMAEVDLWIMTTPEFMLKTKDLNVENDMKGELLNQISCGLGALWDIHFLQHLNTCTSASGQITYRKDDIVTRDDIVNIANIMIDDVTLTPGGGTLLMHETVFGSMPCWKETEGQEDDYMGQSYQHCLDQGILFGLDLLLSAHHSKFKDVYCFKPDIELGKSYRSKPEVMIRLTKGEVRISCRIMAARAITNTTAMSRSAAKPGGAPITEEEKSE